MKEDRFHRQIMIFGEEGQRHITRQHVGVVGLGGLGSHMIQGLAYLGVAQFTIIDYDRVTVTNLNRLIGATAEDAERGTLKTEVSKRMILRISPGATVHTISRNLRSESALKALTACDVIFGAVDNDGARLILTELSAAYTITLIDSATEIPPAEEGEPVSFGGRVVVARPGKLCLMCAREIDPEQAKADLEDDATRAVRHQHGYGLGDRAPSPAVVSVNGAVANLAVTEFMVHVTGLREPVDYLHYIGHEGKVKPRKLLGGPPECFTCTYICGKRQAARIERFARNS